MHVETYIYDSETAGEHVGEVLDRLEERDEPVELLDVAATDDRGGAVREGMLTVRESVRIGKNPEGIYDENGDPDFSAGVLVTEQPTGRRDLHVGVDALEALRAGPDGG